MKTPFRYGPTKLMTRIATTISWPLIKYGKRSSNVPLLKHIINPFFKYPYNELTSIPIGVELKTPDSVALPTRVVERFIEQASQIFILDECICRSILSCKKHPKNLGCMALGKGTERMHPSQGSFVGFEEAKAHVQRAAAEGLIANIAHVWIDVLAFGLWDFKRLMFICFCDDCCCLYRTNMKRPGPNLMRTYQRLPGVSINLNEELCNGCGVCAGECFMSMIEMRDGLPRILDDCKGCARCVQLCPQKALRLDMDDENLVFRQLMERVRDVADIS